MKSLHAASLAMLGGMVSAGTMTLVFPGCGSSNNNGPPAMEGGADQTTDVGHGDAATDTAQDTGHEAANVDAGADVVDAGSDRDAAEASTILDAMSSCTPDGDAGPNAIQQYAAQYAQAYCAGQGKCCAGFDAGAFDLAACAAGWQTVGWEGTLPDNAVAYTNCHLNFNSTQGTACIAALQNFACNPDGGPVTAAQYAAVTTACAGVFTGTIPNDAGGCVSSFECANGYCDLTADGGAGTGICTPLVGDGGACQSRGRGAPLDSDMCTQQGSYQPALWCNRLDGGANGTCMPPLEAGTTCYVPSISTTYWNDYGCAGLLCGDDFLCGDPATYPPPGFCASYAPDAGGGG